MIPFLPRQRPMYLTKQTKEHIPPGWGKGGNPFIHPGETNDIPGDDLPLFGLIWYVYDQDNPQNTGVADLQATKMKKGYNWSVWLSALTARINAREGTVDDEIIDDGTYITLKGEAILDLASMLDLVFFGHWPPPEHVQIIKQRSLVGTKIVCWTDFDSLHHTKPWVVKQQYYWTWLDQFPLEPASGVNRYGCTVIDKYETNALTDGLGNSTVGCPHTPVHNSLPWPAEASSPLHTFDLDLYAATGDGDHTSQLAATAVESYVLSLVNMGYQTPTSWLVDGFCWDNVLSSPYNGFSTLEYDGAWPAEYRAGWLAFLDAFPYHNFQVLGLPEPISDWLWGNCELSVSTYSSSVLKNRYSEHFFWDFSGNKLKSLSQIQGDLSGIAANGLRVILGINPGSGFGLTQEWATSAGAGDATWAQIVSYVRSLGIENSVYACAAQTFVDAYICHQSGWRVPA